MATEVFQTGDDEMCVDALPKVDPHIRLKPAAEGHASGDEEHFAFLAHGVAQHLADQRVRHAEITIVPWPYLRRGIAPASVHALAAAVTAARDAGLHRGAHTAAAGRPSRRRSCRSRDGAVLRAKIAELAELAETALAWNAAGWNEARRHVADGTIGALARTLLLSPRLP